MTKNAKPRFSKIDVIREYLVEFPNVPKATLARIIFRDHPKLWRSAEVVRTCIRVATGASGDRIRKYTNHPEFFRDGKFGDPFPKLPEGLRHFEEWRAHPIPGPARILDLPDVHIPYHDHNALKLAIDYGITYQPTHILLSGDFVDFFSVSRWEKDPRKRNLKQELEMARDVLHYIRRTFANAKIILKVGNHEERWDRYLAVKAPELFGVPEFQLDGVLHTKDYDVEIVSDMRPIKAGMLYIVHGHEFKWGITNPVNPARGFYLRAKTCCLGHHLHTTSSHNEKSLDGVVVSCWSTGCLCDLHPDYSPINKWNHGFATINLEKDDCFEVHNMKIIDGRIFEG